MTACILKYTFSILTTAILLYFSVLLSAGAWFKYTYKQGVYTFYSNTEILKPEALVQELKEQLQLCKVYNDSTPITIYFCDAAATFYFFAKITGVTLPSQGFTLAYLNKVFISKPYIAEVFKSRNNAQKLIPYSVMSGTLEAVVKHELIHANVYEFLDVESYANLPFWKQEGYAEYAAHRALKQRDSLYSFDQRVTLYRNTDFWGDNMAVKSYFEAGLLVEFLLDQKKLSLQEFFDEKVVFSKTINVLNSEF